MSVQLHLAYYILMIFLYLCNQVEHLKLVTAKCVPMDFLLVHITWLPIYVAIHLIAYSAICLGNSLADRTICDCINILIYYNYKNYNMLIRIL